MFDAYWAMLPRYQGVDLDQLQFQRFLYGVFPTYRSSPLQTPFDRILAVGDASGICIHACIYDSIHCSHISYLL